MDTPTINRLIHLTEAELATLLAAEYQRGYGTGIVIGRSGAVLEARLTSGDDCARLASFPTSTLF